MDYPWPGNVRELANRIERFVLLADERELLADLNTAATVSSGFVLPAEGLNWQQHERDCLLQALSRSNGNRAQAAKLLQLPYKAFLYRLEKYQLG
jgi:two-component system NtrC family response regulator